MPISLVSDEIKILKLLDYVFLQSFTKAEVIKCKNCSSARKADTAHEASSYECPIFQERRFSIMKTIPFHQGQKRDLSSRERNLT